MQRALRAPALVLGVPHQVFLATVGPAGRHLTQQQRLALAVLLAALAAAVSRRQACHLLLAAAPQQHHQRQLAGLRVALW